MYTSRHVLHVEFLGCCPITNTRTSVSDFSFSNCIRLRSGRKPPEKSETALNKLPTGHDVLPERNEEAVRALIVHRKPFANKII